MDIEKNYEEELWKEINEKIVSVWDDELEYCEDGIKIEDLAPILEKYKITKL